MATATKNTKYVEKLIKVSQEEIVLTLSRREAAALTFILGHIASNTDSIVDYVSPISRSLYALGFTTDTRKYIDPIPLNGLHLRTYMKSEFEKEFAE